MEIRGSTSDPSDLRALAHLKRLLEILTGDSAFRHETQQNPSVRQQLLGERGIALDAAELVPFWELLDRNSLAGLEPVERLRALTQFPLGKLWVDFNRENEARHRRELGEWIAKDNPPVHVWRQRRIASAKSEAYLEGGLSLFPLLAFELSKGCSMQCWFCGFDPPKWQSNFPYTAQNQKLWRDILATAWDLFGPGCRTGVCYHGTDPTDNPEYFSFLKDFHEICGIYPQTTTAAPLRNIEWTRELLRLREIDPSCPDRFSILNLRTLHGVHKTFTPEEMHNVNLVYHNKGALAAKNHCGRALAHPDRLQAEKELLEAEGACDGLLPQLTLECTCGYLINMVDRSIQLISPCNATEQRSVGSTLHAQGTFRDASELRDFFQRTIEEFMPEHLGQEDRLGFREDLQFEKLDDGFALSSRYRRHVMRGNRHFGVLGDLISRRTLATGEVTDRLIDEGMPVMEAVTWLDRLFQQGLVVAGKSPKTTHLEERSADENGADLNLAKTAYELQCAK